MKYFIISIIGLSFFLAGCNSVNKEMKTFLADTDSVAINYFAGNGTMDSVYAVKIIRDKNSITKLTNFVVDKTSSKTFKCGIDGSLHFFKANQVVQDVDFTLHDKDCMHFSYKDKGEIKSAVLTAEAVKLLQQIKQ